MALAVGVDIGGSHISSAVVDLALLQIIPGTYYKGDVNNKGTKENIFKYWGTVINKSLHSCDPETISGIGIAMPGPFQYRKGVAMFEKNDKYEALYEVSVLSEFPKFLSNRLPLRFINDASSFGIGGTLTLDEQWDEKVLAITLGTGFGAAFLENKIPLTKGINIPENGCLWDKAFLNGIADDYFSTRWFISRFASLTGMHHVKGVKAIVELNTDVTHSLFAEFAQNLSYFMVPHLKDFQPNTLLIGGSIAKSHSLFLPQFKNNLYANSINIKIKIMEETEKTNLLGASTLFEDNYWNKVKNNLPDL